MSSICVKGCYWRKKFFTGNLKVFISTIIIFLLIFSLTPCVHAEEQVSPPKAVGGVLDLTHWDFDKQGPVGLDGEWEFYWERLYEPHHFHSGHVKPEDGYYMEIPRSWNGFEVDGKTIEGMGYGTFRLTVKLPENGNPKAIKLTSISTSHKLWVNGRLVSSDGKVGTTREDSEAKHYHKVITLDKSSGTIELVVQVANFMHRRGGIWQSIKLGNSQDILKLRERQVIIDMVLFGSLFIIGLYHLILYLLRRKDKSPLYFGIFCLLISLRSLLVGEIIFLYYFPQASQELVLKLEYMTFYLGIAFYALFLNALFPKELPDKISRIIAAVSFGITLLLSLPRHISIPPY